MLTFKKKYFWLTLVLFLIEVFIALYINDRFIRPYAGDFLVVILIYCFVKTFVQAPAWKVALGVLLFSFLVETLQYFEIVRLLGLQDSRLANIVIGNSFAWEDMAAYALGTAAVLMVEKVRHGRNARPPGVSL